MRLYHSLHNKCPCIYCSLCTTVGGGALSDDQLINGPPENSIFSMASRSTLCFTLHPLNLLSFPFGFLSAHQLLLGVLLFLSETSLVFFFIQFSPAILILAEPSVMRQRRPTPPITVPRGSAHPTPPTLRPALTKHRPQNHKFTICQGRACFFFFCLFPFFSLKGCLPSQLLSNMLSEVAALKR